MGDGRFEDVTTSAGIDKARGNGLGVVTADFDTNGWLDVYVANDGVANQLWLNQGDGSFVDDAAITSYGMGVVSGDIDNDGWIDLYITAFGENSLLKNNGDGTFTDITNSAGVNDSRWSVSASFFRLRPGRIAGSLCCQLC